MVWSNPVQKRCTAMFRKIEQRLAPSSELWHRSPMQPDLEDIVRLFADDLPPERHRQMLDEIRDPDSETAQALNGIQRLARSQIDLHTIPGLEEIALLEDRLEAQRVSAS